MGKDISLILSGAIAMTGIWLCVLHCRFLNVLQDHHKKQWEKLGKPRILSKTIGAEMGMGRFLFSEEYRDLNNPVLSMVGDDLKRTHCLFLSLIIASFIISLLA